MNQEKTENFLLITPFYPPPFIGGSKVYIHLLAENSPVPLDILTSRLDKTYPEITQPRHRLFRSRFIFNDTENRNPSRLDLLFSYGYCLFWLLKRLLFIRYDAILVNAFPFANGFFFLLGRLFRIPIIGIGYAEEFTLPEMGTGLKNFIKRKWIRLTHPFAAGFIVVCDFCRSWLIRLGVKDSRIHIIPPSSIKIKEPGFTLKKKSGYQILSVGRLVERKGFHLLIEAVAKLKSEIPELRLVLVGDGPYKNELLRKVREFNLEKTVTLLGSVDDATLSTLYQESNLFVLPHVMLANGDVEGSPIVFSEASSYGLPVIGGVEGGASTVIEDGRTGFIVDPRNQVELIERMRRLLKNADLAFQMGKAGIEKATRHPLSEMTTIAFEKFIKKWMQIYKTAASTPN